MTADQLAILPLVLPLTTAALCALLWLSGTAQRVLTLAGLTLTLIAALALFLAVDAQGVVATQPGGWDAPFGISIVADRLSALMVLAASVLGLAVAVFAFADCGEDDVHGGFFPLFCGLMTGVNGAFLTGDIFNLYVWFEVLLVCAVGLLLVRRKAVNLDGTVKYIALNLFGTILFVTAVAFLYGQTGTLNMADLAQVLDGQGGSVALTVAMAAFLLALGVKAALFPFFFWLPAAYHTAPIAVSAAFAGLVTKVGVYVVLRLFVLVFDIDGAAIAQILVWIAAITMLAGALAAFAQTDVRRMLAYAIVSGMGYLLIGAAIGTPEAVQASIVYLVHDVIVKGALFMLAGGICMAGGGFDIRRLGGLIKTHPALSVLFLCAGLSLAGIPPFSGFWAKVLIAGAAFESGEMILGGVAIGAGLLTLMAVIKIWMEAFWKAAPDGREASGRVPATVLLPAGALVAVSIAIGVYAQPLIEYAGQAAQDLVEPAEYIQGVLPQGGAQ